MKLIKEFPCGGKLYLKEDKFQGRGYFYQRTEDSSLVAIWFPQTTHRTVLMEAILADDYAKYQESNKK